MGKKLVLTGVTLTDPTAPKLLSGKNLLLNGSFETDIDSPGVNKFQGTEVTSQVTTGATHGTKALQVVTNSNATQGVALETERGLGTQGATYIGAADVTGSGSISTFLRFFYTDGTNENMPASGATVLSGTPQRVVSPAQTANPAKTLDYVRLYIRVATAPATMTFQVDSAKVNEGAIAPPYTSPGA